MTRLYRGSLRAIDSSPESNHTCGDSTMLLQTNWVIIDADRRQRDALIVPVDPVAIVVMRARKTDHLPRRHVLVAAIDRVGKKAILRV